MAIVHVAIGSNRCHGQFGRPDAVVRAAIAALPAVVAVSPIIRTPPLGPGTRRYANAVVALDWHDTLPALLDLLQAMERAWGRRRGRRWGDRVLDLDIVAAGDVVLHSRRLQVPHPELARRRFVLDPLVAIAPDWRHPQSRPISSRPVSHLTARQLRAALLRPKGRPRT